MELHVGKLLGTLIGAMLDLGPCSAPPAFNYGNNCIAW